MTDLSGRICLVTGATRGIGRATAEGLARMGATVLVHGRDAALVETVCREISVSSEHGEADGFIADFGSLAEVARLAAEVGDRYERLDVLVNNAGTGALNHKTSAEGFEWQFAVNHLAPFLLTKLLLDRLNEAREGRIVNVSSMAHRGVTLDFADLNWEDRKYSSLQAYGASKLANILFTRELARRLEGTDTTTNCLHPGVVATNIFDSLGWVGRLFGVVSKPFLLTPEKGAETSIYLASSPHVRGISGRFFDKCRPVAPAPTAINDSAATRLWEISEALTSQIAAA